MLSLLGDTSTTKGLTMPQAFHKGSLSFSFTDAVSAKMGTPGKKDHKSLTLENAALNGSFFLPKKIPSKIKARGQEVHINHYP